MGSLRRKAACVLLASTFFICACATSDKRLSEDLHNDGFTICIRDGEESHGPPVSVTDTESTERLLQWFRDRPYKTDDLHASFIQHVSAQGPDFFRITVRLETDHFRATIPIAIGVVILETRDTSADEWDKVSWVMREEDTEIKQWALDEYKKQLMALDPEALKAYIDESSSDSETTSKH